MKTNVTQIYLIHITMTHEDVTSVCHCEWKSIDCTRHIASGLQLLLRTTVSCHIGVDISPPAETRLCYGVDYSVQGNMQILFDSCISYIQCTIATQDGHDTR